MTEVSLATSATVGSISAFAGDAAYQGASIAMRDQTGFSINEMAINGAFGFAVGGGVNVVSKVVAPFASRLFYPLWQFGEPSNGALGEYIRATDTIVIRSDLVGNDLNETVAHEAMHSALYYPNSSPGSYQSWMNNLSVYLHDNSQLYKFSEETLAESWATGNPVKSALWVFDTPSYAVTLSGVGSQFVLSGSIYMGLAYGANQIGYSLSTSGWIPPYNPFSSSPDAPPADGSQDPTSPPNVDPAPSF